MSQQISYKTALAAKGIRPIPPTHEIRVMNPKPGAVAIVLGKIVKVGPDHA